MSLLVKPCLLVGDLNIEPEKIPCLLKGFMAGHWFDLQSSWAAAAGVAPLPTCCRALVLMVGPGGILFLIILLLLLR